MSCTLRGGCLAIALGMSIQVICTQAWAIGRAPNGNVGLPAALQTATVRVTGAHTEGPIAASERVTNRGSGVIIDIKPDAAGGGGWICVLTADHVTGQQLETPAGQNWRDPAWQIGLGNGTLAGGPWMAVDANLVFRPAPVAGNRIDLTLMGLHLNNLAGVTSVPIGTGRVGANAPADSLAQAGYGDDVTAGNALVNAFRNYQITAPNDAGQRYGTYRDGINLVDAIENTPVIPIDVVNYQYSALRSDLDFQPAPNGLPITFGESHLLNGDSGGPAFQMNAQMQWQTVGIHSVSQTQDAAGTGDGYATVLETSQQYDVNVWQYREFINNACMMVPEPNAWLLAAMGALVAVLLVRRRGVKWV